MKSDGFYRFSVKYYFKKYRIEIFTEKTLWQLEITNCVALKSLSRLIQENQQSFKEKIATLVENFVVLKSFNPLGQETEERQQSFKRKKCCFVNKSIKQCHCFEIVQSKSPPKAAAVSTPMELKPMSAMTNFLPRNSNGLRTHLTCELCGFEPTAKNRLSTKSQSFKRLSICNKVYLGHKRLSHVKWFKVLKVTQ